jgi:hypothetical protein
MLRCLCCTAGGAVFCSFATPNLSFWSLMPLPTAQSQATGKPRKLPTADNHHKLNRSKYYVTFVTNEGDTPRIVDSLFGAAWADPRRGSVPVAWAIGTPHVHTLAYSHTHIHTSYVHQSRTTSESSLFNGRHCGQYWWQCNGQTVMLLPNPTRPSVR